MFRKREDCNDLQYNKREKKDYYIEVYYKDGQSVSVDNITKNIMEDFKNWIKDNTRKEPFEIEINHSEGESVQTIIWKEGCCMIKITGY